MGSNGFSAEPKREAVVRITKQGSLVRALSRRLGGRPYLPSAKKIAKKTADGAETAPRFDLEAFNVQSYVTLRLT